MFYYTDAFNQYIGDWDVSKVTDMHEMFYYAYAFNEYIADWDVSQVTDMSRMFQYASAFDKPIGEWDVSNVTNMHHMFYYAYAFDRPIGEWDVSNVERMESMFESAHAFNQYIGDWDVSKVEDMRDMFKDADAFNKDLDGWYWVKSNVDKTSWSSEQRALIPDASTVKCPPGKSYLSKKCSSCAAGWHQPKTVRNPSDDVLCEKCPAGEVQPNEGRRLCLKVRNDDGNACDCGKSGLWVANNAKDLRAAYKKLGECSA
jgi:surface protein